MMSFGLLPTITVPTRIKEKSATLLDNIFINCAHEDYYTRVIFDDISDHFPILININSEGIKSSTPNILKDNKYIMSDNNFHKFHCYMRSEDWSILEKQNIDLLSPHESYNIFLERFKNNYDRAFLTCNTNPHKKKSQPWMPDGLIKSCRKKSRLLKVYKKKPVLV